MHHTVYKTTNLLTGSYYIGVHKTKKPLDGYLGSGTRICEEIRIYGVKNFRKEILFDFKTEEESYKKEEELVDLRDPLCLNLSPGGVFENRWTQEFKDACSGSGNSQFGSCWITKDGKNKKVQKIELLGWITIGWKKGRSVSEATLENLKSISRSSKGTVRGPRSEEIRKKISDTLQGHPVSEETIEKLKKTVISPEHREKVRTALTGLKRSEETKNKIQRTLLSPEINKKLRGRTLSEESKRKISSTLKSKYNAPLAQLEEHFPPKEEVDGSNLSGCTN